LFRIGVIFLALFISLSGGVAGESRRTPLTPVHLDSNYRGEHEGRAHHQPLPDRNVQYLNTLEERATYLVQIRDGKLMDLKGEIVNTGPNVKSPKAIFVFSEDHKIYLSTQSAIGSFHHSTFLAGDPVWFAGEIGVEKGEILYVNNLSGHYKTSPRHGLQFLGQIEEAGMDLSKVNVDFIGYGYEGLFFDEPNTKEIREFTRYALGDLFKKSYSNPNLMPMMKRYESSIREALLQDPRALIHLLNTMERSLLPEQEELLLDAVQKYRKQIFSDPMRTRNFKTYFSQPVVISLSPICKVPDLFKNLFKLSNPLSH